LTDDPGGGLAEILPPLMLGGLRFDRLGIWFLAVFFHYKVIKV